MNIIELQDNLKDLPDRRLIQEMQTPTGNMPQFLVLSELTRRKRMRDDYNRQDAANMPTVAEEVMTAAGVPQGGITAIARNMAPNSSIAQNTSADMAVQREPTRMPQKMSDGGVLRLNQGNKISSGTSISDTFLPARIEMVLRGNNVNDRMYVAEQVLTGVYGPEMQSQFTSNMLVGNYGDELKNIAEQFNTLTNQEETSLNPVSTDIEDFTPTVDFNASDRGFEPTNIAPVAAMSEVPVRSADAVDFNDSVPNYLRSIQGMKQFDETTPVSNRQIIDSGVPIRGADTDPAQQLGDFLASRRSDLPGVNLPGESNPYIIDPDAAEASGQAILNSITPSSTPTADTYADQQISYQSGKEPFRRFGANYYDVVKPPEGKEMVGDRDRIMATAGRIFPKYLENINKRINAPDIAATDEPTTEEQMLAASGALDANYTDPQATSTLSGNNFSNDPTTGYSYPTDVLPLDPRMEGKQVAGRVIDALTEGEGGGLPEDIYGGFEDPEAIAMREQRLRKPTDLPDELRYNDPDLSEFLTPKLGQTTGTGLSLEGGVESLLPPSLTGGDTGGDTGDGLGGDTGGGAGSTVGDSYSTLEGRISKMLDDREKSAESDKYLALAQAGLALMASDSPTLGGAIGEAGLVGISQMREARNQYDKDILGLLGTQADIDAARSDTSIAERKLDLQKRGLDLEELGLDRSGMKPGDLLDYLAALNKQQTTLTKQLSENLFDDSDGGNDVKNRIILNELEIDRVKKQLGYGSSTKDLAD